MSGPRLRARSSGGEPFVPRVLVGGWLESRLNLDLRYEGRRRGVSGDTRPTEDIFELWSRGQLYLEARYRRRAKARIEARVEHGLWAERPAKGNFFWIGNGQAWQSRAEVTLREAYVDLYLGPVDLRIGQQVTSWGLNPLLNPNDVTNPMDLRRGDLVLQEDVRIPVLGVRAAYHWRWLQVETLWQPFFRPHKVDLWGSDFALLGPGASGPLAELERALDAHVSPSLRPALSPLLLSTDPPRDDLSASSAGLRVSAAVAGWDIGLQYWFGWDRTPAVQVDPDLYRAAANGELFVGGELNLTALGALLAGRPLYRATYRRGHRVGLSVGKAFSAVAVRLDMAYAPNQGYLRLDAVPVLPGSGPVSLRQEHHSLVTALSVEYAYGTRLLVQVQGVHAALLDRQAHDQVRLWGFGQGRQLGLLLLGVRLQLLEQRLQIVTAAVMDVVGGSYALAPSIRYRLTEAWRLGLGVLLFEGEPETLLGTWTRNDLAWADVRWSF